MHKYMPAAVDEIFFLKDTFAKLGSLKATDK